MIAGYVFHDEDSFGGLEIDNGDINIFVRIVLQKLSSSFDVRSFVIEIKFDPYVFRELLKEPLVLKVLLE